MSDISNETKIINLIRELVVAKTEKKETVKTLSENIKRIQAEIDDLIKELPE